MITPQRPSRLPALIVIAGLAYTLSGPVFCAAGASDEISFPTAAVVSVDPIASSVGVGILKKGGNAVDAAIATGFALAVTWPSAGNLGGGGFMVIYLADKGEVKAIDYREKAPVKSTARMFLTEKGEVDPGKADVGYLVIGVPGTVRGFWEASRRYGKLDWKTLVEPAITLARDGFIVDAVLARSLLSQAGAMDQFPEFARDLRKPNGRYYEAGDRLNQPDLAWTLQQIKDRGADGFYKGEVAQKLVRDIQANGGIITLNDLANDEAKVRTPVRSVCRPRAQAERPLSRC
ncbi:MAG: hypothetical protein DMG13_17390 [Acidobacteria bacterium]|nr:MAG: hypothetical protein DMG13_17390 [Acidobacteriota bacterium]